MALPPITFPTLGWEVIDWVETYLCHGPGDVQGEPFVFDDEEALLVCWIYRLWPKDHQLAGRRLVHRAIYSRPKGRRKSELAGALMSAEALAPVRFDGWNAEGDPVGRPVTYPFIRCLATEEEQTGNTYDNVVYMLTEGRAADEFDFDIGRTVESSTRVIIREPGGGEIVPSTSGDASKDGGKESAATADETHLYVQRQLRSMYRTVARNTGKRKIAEPWMLDTTTAFEPGEGSIAEQAAEKYGSMDTEECVTKKGVLYDHRQGDEPKRFGDDRSLIKAMKPGYGPAAEWMDFARIVKIVRDAEDPEAEGYRYYLNRPRKAAGQWVGVDKLKAVFDRFEVELGSMIGLGFDGSKTDDHTALWGCTEDGKEFPIGIWIPSLLGSGWEADVHSAVDWTMENFQVVRFYGDPAWWQEEMGAWAAKYASDHRKVVEFWTDHNDGKMAIAFGAMRTAINAETTRISPVPLHTAEIHVDAQGRPQASGGTSLALWHFQNARARKVRVKLDDKAETAHVVQKEKRGSPLKIDSVPAATLARRARDDGIKEGEFVKAPTYKRFSNVTNPGRARKTDRSKYLPCKGCKKPIHPSLHAPDAAERGLCVKCRKEVSK